MAFTPPAADEVVTPAQGWSAPAEDQVIAPARAAAWQPPATDAVVKPASGAEFAEAVRQFNAEQVAPPRNGLERAARDLAATKALGLTTGNVPSERPDFINAGTELLGKGVAEAANLPGDFLYGIGRATGANKLASFAQDHRFEQGKPVVPLVGEAVRRAVQAVLQPKDITGMPEAKTSPAAAGLGQSAKTLADSFTTPEGIAMLPALEAKAARAIMLGDSLLKTPEQIKQTVAIIHDPKSTTEEKWKAIGDSGVQLGMDVLLGHSLGGHVPSLKGEVARVEKPAVETPAEAAATPEPMPAAVEADPIIQRAAPEAVAEPVPAVAADPIIEPAAAPAEPELTAAIQGGGPGRGTTDPGPVPAPVNEPAPTPEEWAALMKSDVRTDLKDEGVTNENIEALLSNKKTPQQVVEEQLGIQNRSTGLDADTMLVEENADGSRSIGFSPEAGPASTTPVNVGQMSHVDAIHLAREQGISRIQEVLNKWQRPPEPATATAFDPAQVQVVELPLSKLKLSKDVPNFKSDADESTGVVRGNELSGKYERLGTAPVVAWRRLNGDLEVITGRHRRDLALRSGEKTIPAQVVDEAKGFTVAMAKTFDAEANIRDGQGGVEDYANYFKHSPQLSESEAAARGLLSRVKGQAGFDLGRHAADDVYALWQDGKISEGQALAITRAAPGNPSAQQIGTRYALKGQPADFISNVIKAALSESGGKAETLDLFGADDSALKQMEEQARKASKIQRDLREQLSAASGAAKKPEVAAKLGINVNDPEAVRAKLAALKEELNRWQNWPLHPDLVAQVKGEAPALVLDKPESVEEQKARLATEAAAKAKQGEAERLAEGAAKPLVGSVGDIGQGDLLGEGDLLSGRPPRVAAMGTSAPRPARPGPSANERAATGLRTQGQQGPTLARAGQSLVQATGKRKWFANIRAIFAPHTIDESGAQMAGVLRSALGHEWEDNAQADHALAVFRKEFDQTPVPRDWKYQEGEPLPPNYEVMRAVDTGELDRLTPAERVFAPAMKRLLDQAVDQVQQVSPNSLRDLMENYFPRIWKDPEANKPAINQLLSHKPWEGPKSFLKQRVLEYFTDGLKQGLVPVSDNPVDVVAQKLGEMYRFVATRRAMEEAKAGGLRKFFYIFEKAPEGWRAVDDPSSTIFKPPTVTIQEAFDAQMRAKTLEMLETLGVSHQRLAKIGGKRWGYAVEGQGITTKFAGPDSVIWHELGHQMDWRYPDLRNLFDFRGKSEIAKQLRALSDLRYEGQTASKGFKSYVRRTEEKMAHLFEDYVHAPEKFQAVAPDVWREFNQWLDAHPEVKNPLNEIKPSMVLKSGSTELFVGGPILLGRWMMPEGAAQVVENYLQPGLGRFATFRNLRQVSGLLNGFQLAGFFHGQFVMNDSAYSGLGLAMYDALNGKPVRALKELAQLPVSPFTSLYRGRKIMQAIRNPAGAAEEYRKLASYAVESNMRAGHGNFDPEFGRRWVKTIREFRAAPSTGAAWEIFWRTPFATMDLALAPVMKFLVPNMKLGIFARMAERVVADNPGIDQIGLRKLLAKAADATEDRLGQVTYDNLFQARAVKDAGQLALRAYGWQLTKYRMIGGGSLDWVRAAKAVATGKKPEVTFRMTYLPAMVAGHAILGATLMYMLTGRKPQSSQDYLFPDTGLKDARGNPVRVSIADFVKDVAADWRAFPNLHKMGSEWTRKLAPFWNMAAEMYKNEDFWGTKIFSGKEIGDPQLDHLAKNLGEGVAYMGKGLVPFSLRPGNKFMEAGVSPGKARMASFFGFNPAPRYATQTPAESLAAEIMQGRMPQEARSQESAQRGQAFAQLVKDIATGKTNAPPPGVIRNKADVTRLGQRLNMSPLEYQVSKMPMDKAMEVWDLASDEEKAKLSPFIVKHVTAAAKSGTVPADRLQRYVKLVQEWQRGQIRKQAKE